MKRHLHVLLFMLLASLFLLGKGVVIGLEGSEPTTIPIPQSNIAGYACVFAGIIWCLPGWMVAKVSGPGAS